MLRALALSSFLIIPFIPLLADYSAQPETPDQQANRKHVEEKLKSIVIDKFIFDEVDSALAMDYLTKRSKELDPEHIGVEFKNLSSSVSVLPKHDIHREDPAIEDVPLSEIVRYICGLANLQYRIEGNSVVFIRSPSSNRISK